jgi:hypothetical protein
MDNTICETEYVQDDAPELDELHPEVKIAESFLSFGLIIQDPEMWKNQIEEEKKLAETVTDYHDDMEYVC